MMRKRFNKVTIIAPLIFAIVAVVVAALYIGKPEKIDFSPEKIEGVNYYEDAIDFFFKYLRRAV